MSSRRILAVCAMQSSSQQLLRLLAQHSSSLISAAAQSIDRRGSLICDQLKLTAAVMPFISRDSISRLPDDSMSQIEQQHCARGCYRHHLMAART